MAAKSPKYAHRYRSGIFGYLMFCACGSMSIYCNLEMINITFF